MLNRLVETPAANLAAGMKWLLGVYVKRLGWAESQLTRRLKGDRHKVAPARRLRAETTMSLAWIAEHLQMGSWSYVSNLLRKTKTHS
jgi:hypothetical protein